jgi:N-methylhydantoinase A
VHEEVLRRQFEAAEADATAELDRDGRQEAVSVRRVIACRYYLQNYEEEVEVPELGSGFIERAAAGFHRLHRAFYGYAFEGEPVELVHCKVTALEATPRERRIALDVDGGAAEPAGTREVVGDDGVPRATHILRRGRLAKPLAGPLVIEEVDSTTYVPVGWTVASAAQGCFVLERSPS